MAISDVIKEKGTASAAPVTPAPATGTTAAPQAKMKAGGDAKIEALKAQGAKIRMEMSEDQKAIEGSKSDKVEFLHALGNPAKKQNRQEDNVNIPSFEVVGCVIKVLEDMVVPVAPLKPDWHDLVDTEDYTEKAVHAGEEVSLTLAEAAIMLSQPEFSGRWTGGAIGVFLGAKGAKNRRVVLPTLNRIGKGSVKENMELIGDMVGGDGTLKGGAKPVLKERFKEQFAPLYAKKTMSKTGTGTVKKQGENQANLAAAMRTLWNKKA